MRSYRNCLVILCVVLVLIVSGCGGGGGKAGPGNNGGPAPIASETFNVTAGQAVDKTIGDVGISIPAGTFTRDASVTVELRTVSSRPTNPSIGTIGSEVAVIPTVPPSGPITIVQNGSMSRSGTPSYLPISWIGGKWRKIGNTTETLGRIGMAIDPKWFAVSGSLRILLSAANSTSMDRDIHLTLLAGDSNNIGDGTAFLVHGIMSDEFAMRPLGQALLAKGYKAVWGLHYDWQLPTDYVSRELGAVLSSCQSVDLFGHSRGVLICRYTLEVLQKRPKTLVNRAILICGPNKGSKLDPEVDFLTSLQEHFLNDADAVGFPIVDTPAVQELTAGSDIVRELNNHDCNSDTGMKYFLFAAQDDLLVSEDSALAKGVNIWCFTGMTPVQEVLPGGHSTLISDPNGIENMLFYL